MGYDAETSDPLYKHVPFYMCENSVGCYGIYYDTSDSAVMDFGREINNYYPAFKFFKSDDDCLVYYVFFGSKLEILRQYCSLCGKQTLPPKWSFDYCASTMAYTDAPNSEEQLYGFLGKLDALNMSCSGFICPRAIPLSATCGVFLIGITINSRTPQSLLSVLTVRKFT